jgi:CRP-like cAMP-binding protein
MSPGSDTMIMSAMDRRNLLALFAALPLLRELDANSIAEFAEDIEWFSVPASTLLYSFGEAADGLYVIINGAFGVYAPQSSGGSQYIGKLAAGQIAGDMEVISGKARSTTLVALRDCEVARLSNATFDKLAHKHPQTLRYVARGLAEQVDTLQQTHRRPATSAKIFAIVPYDASDAAMKLGWDLVACLTGFGRAALISSDQAFDRTSHWFHRLERANESVVYLTDPRPTHWSRMCIRRADVLLLVADADSNPQRWLALDTMDEVAAAMRAAEIVLVHRARLAAGSAVPPPASRARQRRCGARREALDGTQRRARALGRRRAGICAYRRAACVARSKNSRRFDRSNQHRLHHRSGLGRGLEL